MQNNNFDWNLINAVMRKDQIYFLIDERVFLDEKGRSCVVDLGKLGLSSENLTEQGFQILIPANLQTL